MNKPPEILQQYLFKKCIVISASEMHTLTKYLSLIIGDLVPLNNPLWNIYLLLCEIIDIISSKCITEYDHILLRTLISEHHELYIEHFGNLKPKHHFLIHYPYIMSVVGPLINISSIRYEGRHRLLKANATAVTCRKNILYTLAIKNQLAYCHRIIAKNGLTSTLEIGLEDTTFLSNIFFLNLFTNYLNFCSTHNYIAISWVKIKGIKYSPGTVCELAHNDYSSKFGQIIFIIFLNEKEFYFIFKVFETMKYNNHLQSYKITEKDSKNYCCKNINEINIYPVSLHYLSNKDMYVKI